MTLPYTLPLSNAGQGIVETNGTVNDSAYDILRKHLSPGFTGPAWEALLNAAATGDDANWEAARLAFAQLFLETAGTSYLDAIGSKDGVPRPEGVGMGDDNYRALVLALRTRKLSTDAIYRILEVFYGEGATRAYVQLPVGPYDFTDTFSTGVKLHLQFEDGVYVVDFTQYDFLDVTAVTTEEVVSAISKQLNEQGSKAYATTFLQNGVSYLRIYSGALGIKGYVKPLGGLAMSRIGFSGARVVQPEGEYTITKNGTQFDFVYTPVSVLTFWGTNTSGQGTPPVGLSGVKQIDAGGSHTISVKFDGTVVAWGSNANGQTTIPGGLTGVVQVTAGSSHSMALKGDGTVVAWGLNTSGQATVPGGLTDVVQVVAGYNHSLALKSDGTVTAWGLNTWGQTTVPGGLTDVVQIAAGENHSLALKSDGSVVAWGLNTSGQCNVPGGLVAAEIVAGGNHCLALKADGTVTGWGLNTAGQRTIPVGLSDVIEVAAGHAHSLALKSDGTVTAWGLPTQGQIAVPGGLTGVTQISGGYTYSAALAVTPYSTTVVDGDWVSLNGVDYNGVYEVFGVDRDGMSFSVIGSEAYDSGTLTVVAEGMSAYEPLRYTLQETPETALVSVTRGGVEISIPASTIVVDRDEDTASYLDSTDAGPFIYDPVSGYSLTARQSTTTSTIRVQQTVRQLAVTDSDPFSDSGWIILGLGCSFQTGPIRFTGKAPGTLTIDSSVVFDKLIPSGATVLEVLGRQAWQPELDEANDEFTLVNSGVGLRYAKSTIESVTGGGLPVSVNVKYPPGFGLGGHITDVSDIVRIFGGDEPNEDVEEIRNAT